ncbi:MAG: SLC13 family permease [Verrucomicrobiota bacterium]|nr:SLC13 family permease [Verrucomicrobiota bacterium]
MVAAALTILLREHSSLPRAAAFMTGIFVLAALLWVTEAIPLFATSLLVIGLQVILLANPGHWAGFGFETETGPAYREVFAAAADPILLLFLGGFLLARAAVKEGVDRAMSALLLRPFGGRPLVLLTIGLSTFMSNTAAANLLLPIGISSAALLGGNGGPATQAAVSIALAASLSMALPVSTPPNAIAYAAGGFSTRDLRRVGLLVGAAGALFVVLGGGFVLRLWGVIR